MNDTIIPIIRDGRVVDFTVMPAMPIKRGFDPREAGGNTSIPAARFSPLHSAVTNPKGR